ncbi:MAG TPA: hypothetical protein VKB46_27270 [Pyrinomonadaceae bacterium]|nr:hypothetical protein [Pyrinomonadaceae bacterium]
MKLLRIIVILICLAVLLGAAWLWWSWPGKVDMAAYAPADSLVYLEFNSLTDIANAIQQNDTWRALGPPLGNKAAFDSHWWQAIARAGIGPTDNVVFTRAQVAVVVTGLNSVEEAETLRVRPDAALIIETQTNHWRLKSAAINAVKRLATFAYGQALCTEHTADADFVECASPQTDRKIVAAIDGSVVIITNSDTAVRNCLEVRRGLRPSLQSDAELQKVRRNLRNNQSLAFGYVSSTNSARLFSWAAPMLIGKAPGDQQLEQVLTSSATKILRGIAWSSESASGGIEDRYLFSLEPAVVARLGPAFQTGNAADEFWKLVPDSSQSLTIYRSQNPQTAWNALDQAVAYKLDALSAIVFSSLLKSGLAVYGVENPKDLLTTLSSPLVTVRPNAGAEGSVFIGHILNQEQLRHTLTQQIASGGHGQILEGTKIDPDLKKELTAVIVDDYLVLGKTENVQACLNAIRRGEVANATASQKQISHFAPQSNAPILTYANDEKRLSSFVSVVSLLRPAPLSQAESEKLKNVIKNSSFSATETNLAANGIERKTRSAFGQFSTLLSLLQQDTATNMLR